MGEHFQILSTHTIQWSNEKFRSNLKIFYSQSWQHFSSSQLESALRYKCDYCGIGPFTAIVFQDTHSQMDWRITSNGKKYVNIHVFDKKMEYRQFTGGGHLIHCSNDVDETNHDLTLLFGLNTQDFLSHSTKSSLISNNCVGVDGYNSISQLFYVLNNCINYCVLRNFECLPDKYTLAEHGDIDLLVENKQQMACLTLAKPIFSETYRVYHIIRIADKDIPFDFRYVGDNYYDIKWERRILEHRRMEKDLFFVPSDEDLYFSLLYHAYIQKNEVKPDYLPKLKKYAESISDVFNPEPSLVIRKIDSFMRQYDYEYIEPLDKTVVYNLQNIEKSSYALRYGKCIKRTEEDGSNGYVYSSRVYDSGNRIVKLGTKWLIENEALFLSRLSGNTYFPNIISKEQKGNQLMKLEITKMQGCDFAKFFGNMRHQHGYFLRSFMRSMIEILHLFNNQSVVHRDLTPSNIIIEADGRLLKVGIIDFGWAAKSDDISAKLPNHLGGRYALNGAPNDCYALGYLIMEYWSDVPYMKIIASYLLRVRESNKDKQLKKVERVLQFPFSPYDQYRLFLRRHQRISQTWHRI